MFYNVITIVVSSVLDPWINIENNGIRETWLTKKDDNNLVLFYYGGVDELKVDNDKIFLPQEEGFINMGKKTILLLEYILQNYEFNYIFKTNTSSYIDLNLLNEYIIDKPKENLYSGIVGNHNGIEFVSGCGVLLSKDMVELFVNNKDKVRHDIIEDVSMGLFFKENNIKIIPGPRFDVNFSNENSIPNNHFHYRCKDYERGDRLNDIRRMKIIHDLKT